MAQTFVDLLETGRQQTRNQQFDAAIETFQSILQKDPNQEEPYYKLAELFAVRGLIPQTISQYLKLINLLEKKVELDGALEICKWVMDLDPSNTKARLKLIDILKKQNNFKEVIKHSLTLSKIYTTLGQGDQAIALIQQVQELKPEDLELTLQLGEIYIRQGQIHEGLAIYKQISAEYQNRNDLGRAVDIIKRIKTIKSDDLNNLFALGSSLFKLERYEEAKTEFRLILRHDLSHTEALKQLGLISKVQGNFAEAELPFKKIADVDPDNGFARKSLGEIYEAMGDEVKAVRHYLAAGEIYERLENREDAILVYQNILAIDPYNSVAKNRLDEWNIPVTAKALKTTVSDVTDTKTVPVKQAASQISPVTFSELKESELPQDKETDFESVTIKSQGATYYEVPAEKPKQHVTPSDSIDQQKIHAGQVKDAPQKKEIKKGLISKNLPGLSGVIKQGVSQSRQQEYPGAEQMRGIVKVRAESQNLAKPGMLSKNQEAGTASKPGLLKKSEATAAIKPQLVRSKHIETIKDSHTPKEYPAQQPSKDIHEKSESSLTISGEISVPQEDLAAASIISEPAEAVCASQPEPVASVIAPAEAVCASQPEPVASVIAPVAPMATKEYEVSETIAVLQEDLSALLTSKPGGELIKSLFAKLQQEPSNLELHIKYAIVLKEYGLTDESLVELQKIVAEQPDNLTARRALWELYILTNIDAKVIEEGIVLFRLYDSIGDQERSLEVLGSIIAINDKNIPARRELIKFFLRNKQQGIAMHHYQALVKTLEENQQYEDLISSYRELLLMTPQNIDILYGLAKAYEAIGNLEDARGTYLALAATHEAQQQWSNSSKIYQILVASFPGELPYHEHLRDIYERLGEQNNILKEDLAIAKLKEEEGALDDAIIKYESILNNNPNNIEILDQLWQAYVKKGAVEKILEEAQKLIPVLLSNNNIQRAIEVYQILIAIKPEELTLHKTFCDILQKYNHEALLVKEYTIMGQLYTQKGKFNEAIEAYRNAINIDPSLIDARYQLGVILADHKFSLEEAVLEFQHVCNANPGHSAAIRRLASAYMKQGEGEQAVAAARKLIDLDSKNVVLLEDMLLDVKAILEREPTNALAILNLGIINRELGKVDFAIEQFQKARKFKDTFLKASNYLGLCFQEKAHLEHNPSMLKIAIQHFEKGVQAKGFKDDEYLDLHYNLGVLYERMGEIKQAIGKYREVLAIDIKYHDVSERIRRLEEEENSSKILRIPQVKREQSSS